MLVLANSPYSADIWRTSGVIFMRLQSRQRVLEMYSTYDDSRRLQAMPMMVHEGQAETHCKPANTLCRAAQDQLHIYQKLFEEFNNTGSYVDPPFGLINDSRERAVPGGSPTASVTCQSIFFHNAPDEPLLLWESVTYVSDGSPPEGIRHDQAPAGSHSHECSSRSCAWRAWQPEELRSVSKSRSTLNDIK